MVFKKVRVNALQHIENEFKAYLMVKFGITNTIIIALSKVGLSKLMIAGVLILL